jgi:thiol-disulfide isomerase/thioredoxin
MKKSVRLILWIIPIMLLAFCIFTFTHPRLPILPSLSLQLPDSVTIFNTEYIQEGKPSVLIFFSPDCEHCQDETINIIKNIDSLKRVNILFITIDPFDRLKAFYNFYKIANYPNITMGRDISYYFPNHFKELQPPFLVIYDSQKKERIKYSGEIEVKKLIEYVNKL